MSKVYSFRLNENNPREAQAKEVIDAWVSKGYPLRHVITKALLKLSTIENGEGDLSDIVEQIRELFTGLEGSHPIPKTSSNALSPSFVESIRLSMKSGQDAKQY